ncbi:terminase small subunit [Chromobacterium phragmitis]|uniref:terminase small subunit n=1 Tax=Chromobacterium phragmitis TaxID=2202141 RepID=UPI0039A08300
MAPLHVHFNATQAAIEAGYSPKTAKQQASQLLQHPAIAHRLAAWRRDVREVSEQIARADRWLGCRLPDQTWWSCAAIAAATAIAGTYQYISVNGLGAATAAKDCEKPRRCKDSPLRIRKRRRFHPSWRGRTAECHATARAGLLTIPAHYRRRAPAVLRVKSPRTGWSEAAGRAAALES